MQGSSATPRPTMPEMRILAQHRSPQGRRWAPAQLAWAKEVRPATLAWQMWRWKARRSAACSALLAAAAAAAARASPPCATPAAGGGGPEPGTAPAAAAAARSAWSRCWGVLRGAAEAPAAGAYPAATAAAAAWACCTAADAAACCSFCSLLSSSSVGMFFSRHDLAMASQACCSRLSGCGAAALASPVERRSRLRPPSFLPPRREADPGSTSNCRLNCCAAAESVNW